MLALSLGMPVAARAEESGKGMPAGRFGMTVGVRQGLGQLGDDFGIGGVGGISAGYSLTDADRRLSLGVHWNVLWSWFGSDDTASIAGSLSMIELGLGLRARTILDEKVPRALFIGGGASLLRTNVPIPPCSTRRCMAPYVSVGLEQLVLGAMLLGFEARYDILPGGSGSMSMMLSLGFGK